MTTKRIFITAIFSMFVTLASPFFFNAFFEKKPSPLEQIIDFGGPFPYASQKATLPYEDKEYPQEINFKSPIKTETTFHIFPFMLSFLIFFTIFVSILSVIVRFFNKTGHYEK